MTRTIDVTGLSDEMIQLVESHVKRLREGERENGIAGSLEATEARNKAIREKTPEERVASFLAYIARNAITDVVIEDDSRRSMPL